MILSVYTYLEQVEVVQEKNNRVPARKKKSVFRLFEELQCITRHKSIILL